MEMGDKNKAVFICPAGKIFRDKYTIKDCFQQYSYDCMEEALKHEKNIFYEKEKEKLKWKRKCIPKKVQRDELPGILDPHVKTKFQVAIEDLQNTCYASYWDKQLGTRKDNPLPYPLSVPWQTITFGVVTPSSMTAKDCMSTYWKLEDESPKQKFERKLKEPVMPLRDRSKDPCPKFSYDKRGIWMKCCMRWAHEHLTVGDSILADYQETFGHKLQERRKIPKPLEKPFNVWQIQRP